jgi:hypothetical protein
MSATTKISDLDSLTNPARGDILLISDVSASVSKKVTVRELVAQCYGDMKLAAATATMGLTTTPAKLTLFDASTAVFNCSVALDFDDITVDSDGVYLIQFTVGGYLDAAKVAVFQLSINGTEDADSQAITAIPSGAANAISAGFTVLRTLSAADVISMEGSINATTANFTANNIDLVIRKLDSLA